MYRSRTRYEHCASIIASSAACYLIERYVRAHVRAQCDSLRIFHEIWYYKSFYLIFYRSSFGWTMAHPFILIMSSLIMRIKYERFDARLNVSILICSFVVSESAHVFMQTFCETMCSRFVAENHPYQLESPKFGSSCYWMGYIICWMNKLKCQFYS